MMIEGGGGGGGGQACAIGGQDLSFCCSRNCIIILHLISLVPRLPDLEPGDEAST